MRAGGPTAMTTRRAEDREPQAAGRSSRTLARACRQRTRPRSSERLAHDEGGGLRSVVATIIAQAFPDFDEAEALVQRQRRRVHLVDFEEHRPRPRVRGLTQVLVE